MSERTFQWQRGPVILQDGAVIPQGPRESYELPLVPRPEEENGRPAYLRFISLKDAPDGEIAAFASKYGLLGFSRRIGDKGLSLIHDIEAVLETQDPVSASKIRELTTWIHKEAQGLLVQDLIERFESKAHAAELEGHSKLAEGLRRKITQLSPFLTENSRRLADRYKDEFSVEAEPISQWRQEAADMELLLRMIRLAEDGAAGADDEGFSAKFQQILGVEVGELLIEDLPTPRERTKHLLKILHGIISEQINSKLHGRIHFTSCGDSKWAFAPQPTILLEALYAQAASSLTCGQLIKVCGNPWCPSGGWFITTNPRSRYCGKRCRDAMSQRWQRERKKRIGQ